MFREIYNLHSTLIASNDNISMPVDKIMIWAKTSFHLFEERRFLYENVLEEEWPKMSLNWYGWNKYMTCQKRKNIMDVNFEYYKIFYYVARYHNFTKAAKVLGNSQPNVTRAMNCLEQQLGRILFVRTFRVVQLTWDGEQLYSYVEAAMSQLLTAEDELADGENLTHGSITIGVSETA